MVVLNVMVIEKIYPDAFQDELSTGSIWVALMLVMIEAPLATAPITLYLGQALFVERPKPLPLRADLWLACRKWCCCRCCCASC